MLYCTNRSFQTGDLLKGNQDSRPLV
jgi:hypothetical protein